MSCGAAEVLKEATEDKGDGNYSEDEFVDASGDRSNDLTRPSEWTPEDKVRHFSLHSSSSQIMAIQIGSPNPNT